MLFPGLINWNLQKEWRRHLEITTTRTCLIRRLAKLPSYSDVISNWSSVEIQQWASPSLWSVFFSMISKFDLSGYHWMISSPLTKFMAFAPRSLSFYTLLTKPCFFLVRSARHRRMLWLCSATITRWTIGLTKLVSVMTLLSPQWLPTHRILWISDLFCWYE